VGEWRRGSGRAPAGATPAPVSRVRLALGIAFVLGYVAALPALGYPAATALFVAVFMPLAGARAPAGIAAAAVGGTVGLLYLFVKVVYLPLPKGGGALEPFTLWLYRALGIF
jgi:putative tricarboxylic transport membrane protein